MPVGDIRTWEDAALRQRARPVARVDAAVRERLEAMAETMYAAHGVGLAAPQVGLDQRLVVVDVGDGLYQLVNPELVGAEGVEVGTEACLSVPGLMGEVPRAARVAVAGLDEQGRKVWVEAEGLLARALQHELDHLDGVLFVDRAIRLGPPLPRKDAAEKAEPDGEAEAAGSAAVGLAPPENGETAARDRDLVAGDLEAAYAPFRREPWHDEAALALRIAFFGTPAFALPSLRALLAHGYPVVGVVTRPDRPAGRGLEPRPSPVRELAESHGVTVLTPEKLRDPDFLDAVRAWAPDVIVVAAYGRILPPALLSVPRLGAINVHPSLLPAYRGAAPIQRALLDGAGVTGVSIMQVSEELDAGAVLLQRRLAIGPHDTAGLLHDKLAVMAAVALMEALAALANGRARPVPQDPARVTQAPPLTAADEVLRWEEPAEALGRRVRALNPGPGARTYLDGRLVKVWAARPVAPAAARELVASGAGQAAPTPGQVVAVLPEAGLAVATGDGLLLVEEVQPAGKGRMPADAFARGYRVDAGTAFSAGAEGGERVDAEEGAGG